MNKGDSLKVLLDADIVIREKDDFEISTKLTELSQLVTKKDIILIHPLSFEGITNEINEKIQLK